MSSKNKLKILAVVVATGSFASLAAAQSFDAAKAWADAQANAAPYIAQALANLADMQKNFQEQYLVAQELVATHKSQLIDPDTGEIRWQGLTPDEEVQLARLREVEEKAWAQLKAYGKIKDRFHLAKRPFDFPMTLLAKDDVAVVLPGTFARSQFNADRFVLRARFRLDNGLIKGIEYSENLWVHYRPGLSAARQTVQLLDASGNEVQVISPAGVVLKDLSVVKRIRILRDGVNAWPNMNGSGDNQSNLFSQKTDRLPAADPRSSQGIKGGQFWSTDCEDFIQPDGSYGPWGLYLYNHNTSANDKVLFDMPPGDIPGVCPNYPKFNEDQKRNFWIWYAAAIAQEESSCNPDVHVKGTYGIAAGLWQLDLGKTKNYCHGICGTINAYNASANVSCGLNMLDWYTGLDRDIDHNVFWKGNYWQTMHEGQSGERRAVTLIKSLRACSEPM
jgi:hypothetical protein